MAVYLEITSFLPNQLAGKCSLVEEGSIRDWRALASFHYRSHMVAGPRRIFVISAAMNYAA